MNTNNHSDNDSTTNQTDENFQSENTSDTSAEMNETENTETDNSTEPNYHAELLELKDKHLRLFAEFENYKKRGEEFKSLVKKLV